MADETRHYIRPDSIRASGKDHATAETQHYIASTISVVYSVIS